MPITPILADVNDINTHLPTDKIDADDPDVVTDVNLYEVDAARFVRSMLSGVFTPVQLAGWSAPANTPDLIRGIAGRLIAAKYYSVRYAEDSETSGYAQGLYDEAVSMIRDIRSGALIVVDVNSDPITTNSVGLDSDDFWPNDTTGAPAFTMDKVWA